MCLPRADELECVSTKIIFIRHCTPYDPCESPPGCLNGWTDVALSQEGQAQAALLAERVRSAGCAFSGLYASPLRRAADTARAISSHCAIPIRFRTELKEINCGVLDGLPIDRVKALHPRLWEENFSQQNEHFRWPGGESYVELRRRCIEVVEETARLHDGEAVVMVTHAGVISQVLGYINGLSPAQWQLFRPDYGSLTEVTWEKGLGRLIAFDDRSHFERAKPE